MKTKPQTLRRAIVRALMIALPLLCVLALFPPMEGRNYWSHWTTHRFVFASRTVLPSEPKPPTPPLVDLSLEFDLPDAPSVPVFDEVQLPSYEELSGNTSSYDELATPKDATKQTAPRNDSAIAAIKAAKKPSKSKPSEFADLDADLVDVTSEYVARGASEQKIARYEIAWDVLWLELGGVIALAVTAGLAGFNFTKAILAAACFAASMLTLYAPRANRLSENPPKGIVQDVTAGYLAVNAQELLEQGKQLETKGDFAGAFAKFREAAEKGNVSAQFLLGSMYEIGLGVVQDKAQAAEWYRKAAEQGDADAQFLLGSMYKTGVGLVKDKAQAAEWFRKAAERGDAGAQVHLGGMYVSGEGVKRTTLRPLSGI